MHLPTAARKLAHLSLPLTLAATASAQDMDLMPCAADGAPRSVFAATPLDSGPLWYCINSNCRFKKRPADFPNWTHTTNTGKPPRTIWIVSCLQSTWFGWRYEHNSLAPGKTQWSLINVPSGHWSWITNWIIDPWGWLLDDHELAHSFSERDESGRIVAETFGTVQVQPRNGLESVTSSTAMMPTDEQPWSVDRTYAMTPTGMTIEEDWHSNSDDLINQFVTMTIVRDPAGYMQTMEVDRGKDGTIDHMSVTDYIELPNGDLELTLRAYDGNGDLESAFDAHKTFQGQDTTMVTKYDDDGDGDADRIVTETTVVTGNLRTIVIERDDGADGSVDETETTLVEFRGVRDSSQITTIEDANGQTLEVVAIELLPTPTGYVLDTFHDENGDFIYDVRETQLSNVGPFGNGVDDDYLGIDNNMDGIYDAISHNAAFKSLNRGVYEEVIGTDVRNDGIVDGVVRRVDTIE
ncbi:MAG: hypothetical protein AAF957_21375 [Planctomycetota bacterium]